MPETIREEATPAETPSARIFSGPDRSKPVPLTWPIEYDGKVYDTVTVRRITGAEVRSLLAQAADGSLDFLPMLDCPQPVYEALDDDDLYEIDKVIADFLPRRLREVAGQTSGNGGPS